MMNGAFTGKGVIYLDNAASAKPSEKAVEAMMDALGYYGNPSSLHSEGQAAKRIVVTAEEKIKRKINASDGDRLVFTSGATMSNSVFIQGWLRRNPGGWLVISAIEHNDIMMLAGYMKEHGRQVAEIGVDSRGEIDMQALDAACRQARDGGRPFLCSVQAANGECGVIQDIRAISRAVHANGGLLHSDMTQYLPYYAVDMSCGIIDAFSMSGQKIGAAKGTGLLYIKGGIEIDPVIFGEQGIVGGTENVPGIACLSAAFEELDYENKSLRDKQARLIDGLAPYGRLVGSMHRLPSNVYWAFDRHGFGSLVVLLDGFGIEVSSGSACASGRPSHVAAAMGYDAESCIRFSLSRSTSDEDIEQTIRTIREIMTL